MSLKNDCFDDVCLLKTSNLYRNFIPSTNSSIHLHLDMFLFIVCILFYNVIYVYSWKCKVKYITRRSKWVNYVCIDFDSLLLDPIFNVIQFRITFEGYDGCTLLKKQNKKKLEEQTFDTKFFSQERIPDILGIAYQVKQVFLFG